MSSFTITSHEIGRRTSPADEQRASLLHRRIAQESFGWPQAWSLWQNVPMTPWGYPMSAAPFARGASGTPTDRLGGRDIPLYWNEVDLRGFRVLSKFLTDTNQFGKGFLNRLVDYHVRKGFGWQACLKGVKKTPYPTQASPPDPIVEKGQRILDTFRDRTSWPLQSREAYRRLQRDGEVFGWFGTYAGRSWFRFIAADQVGNPSGDTTTPQSFGIECDPHDLAEKWAYHVWDVSDYPSGGEWLDASDIIHVTANVDSDVKRGLPSFFPVQDTLDMVRKLLSNMVGSSTKMSAVAWREKFPTASASQVQQLIPLPAASDQVGYGPGPYGVPGYAGWSGGVNGFQQGEVIKVEGNREYEEGPTAAGVANFIEAEQAALRGAAVSFGFPESIATGKIDDINFAAALTTGAPFALAIEGGQYQYGCLWERKAALKVLELAFRNGELSATEWRALDVEVEEPSPLVTEPEKETNRRKVLNESRVLSPQTWQLMESLDPQHEEANFASFDAANPQLQPGYVEQVKGELNQQQDGETKQLGPASESTDSSGHKHVDSGPKGGQFTAGGGSDEEDEEDDEEDEEEQTYEEFVKDNGGRAKPNADLPDQSRPKLSDKEIREVQLYLDEQTEYYDLNAHLRGGSKMLDDTLQKALDKVQPFYDPVTVMRGISVDDTAEILEELRSGEFVDLGFMSASTQRPFPGNVQLTIEAVKGLDASYYGSNSGELLLPSGSRFEVVEFKETKAGVTARLKQIIARK